MVDVAAGMVEIIRDFLVVHRSLTAMVSKHRKNELRFHLIRELVGDDRSSVFFRFKEHCHAIFRNTASAGEAGARTGVLFDLAVGSLFHEAMKLRENLYQHEVYRPRVEALRAEADPASRELVDEFDKICASAGDRIDESVAEAEILLKQTSAQLLRLIVEQKNEWLVSRCLYSEAERVAAVYPQGLDAIFEEVHGDAVTGYVQAADSYLSSAHFNSALTALAEAARRAPDRPDINHRVAYAEGMRAFRDRDYRQSVGRLSDWIARVGRKDEAPRLELALSAISHVKSLYEGEDAEDVIRAATELADTMTSVLGVDAAGASAGR